jgi:hypothetical protein
VLRREITSSVMPGLSSVTLAPSRALCQVRG